MNAELHLFKNGEHNSKSVSSLDRGVAPLLVLQLKSLAQTNKMLIDKLSPPASPKRSKPRRRTKKCTPEPGIHYRLNMNDIPFVVGQVRASFIRLYLDIVDRLEAMT